MANKKKMASRMRCSVVVLGDSRAGKSALIRRFVEGKFSEVGSNVQYSAKRCRLGCVISRPCSLWPRNLVFTF